MACSLLDGARRDWRTHARLAVRTQAAVLVTPQYTLVLRRLSPRCLELGVVASACAIGLALASCQRPNVGHPLPPDVSGKLVYVTSDGFWVLDLTQRSTTELLSPPSGTFASVPTASPNGQQIAYSLSRYPTASSPGGTELYITDVSGHNSVAVVPGVAAAQSPAWTPDGQALYVTRAGPDNRDRIERVTRAGRDSKVIVPHADDPAMSPDGLTLAYIVTDPASTTQTAWMAAADGSGAHRILGPPTFALIQDLRFSPDGHRLVFSAVLAYPGQSQAPKGQNQYWADWFLTRTAEAHALPYDIWILNLDDNTTSRLTTLEQHVAFATWSRDGRWIAFTGEPGLYIVDNAGRTLDELGPDALPVGLTWIN